MNEPIVTLQILEEIFKICNLRIPCYQRPYTWSKKHVDQLLDDIRKNMREEDLLFRLGTIILHKDPKDPKEEVNIVDGQQRLVTLSIILYFLAQNDGNISPLLKEQFPHNESKANIKRNYNLIIEWFKKSDTDVKKLKNFILKRCQFVLIELSDISEAFQLFDSQNARGKPLEPYDLLKAFHLREMSTNSSEEERRGCVAHWEKAVNDSTLKNLGLYLYRIRKWAKREAARSFTKDEISEFKGFNINDCKYPYLKSYLLTDAMVDAYSKDKIISNMVRIQYPFQINQLIINGKRFFEYVFFYSELFRELFPAEASEDSEFSQFYKGNCLYDGCNVTGDRFVREMFHALCLFFVDKFGNDAFTESVYTTLYKWCYKLRRKNSSVFYSSIDKYILESGNMFEEIDKEYKPAVFKDIYVPTYEVKFEKRSQVNKICDRKAK
jgi:uncharacterized protein with ParB-like and HNH nuclease domain